MEITSSEVKNIIKESIQESYEKPKVTQTIAECASLTGIGRDKLMELAHSNNSDFPCFKVRTKFFINRKLLSIWLRKISQEKRILQIGLIGLIRKLIETCEIKMTDEEFKETMEIATDDIKFNRILFNKRTNLRNVVIISKRSYKVVKNHEEDKLEQSVDEVVSIIFIIETIETKVDNIDIKDSLKYKEIYGDLVPLIKKLKEDIITKQANLDYAYRFFKQTLTILEQISKEKRFDVDILEMLKEIFNDLNKKRNDRLM